jgi:hypothetical protein
MIPQALGMAPQSCNHGFYLDSRLVQVDISQDFESIVKLKVENNSDVEVKKGQILDVVIFQCLTIQKFLASKAKVLVNGSDPGLQ